MDNTQHIFKRILGFVTGWRHQFSPSLTIFVPPGISPLSFSSFLCVCGGRGESWETVMVIEVKGCRHGRKVHVQRLLSPGHSSGGG